MAIRYLDEAPMQGEKQSIRYLDGDEPKQKEVNKDKTIGEMLKTAYSVANMPSKKSAEGLKMLTDMIPDPETKSAVLNFVLGTPKTVAEIGSDLASSSISPESLALMAVPAGTVTKGAKALSKFAEKKLPAVSQALSGVSKEVFKKIFKNPKILLPKFLGGPASREVAGEAVGAAEKKAFGEAAKATAMEINDPALSTARKNAIKAAQEVESLKEISKTDPQFVKEYLADAEVGAKILKGKRGTQAQLGQPSTKGSKKALLTQQAEEFNKILSENYPDLQAALGDYAASITKEQATRLLPVLKSGDPSYMRIVLSALGRSAGVPFGLSVPAVNSLATALTSIGIGGLEKLSTIPTIKKLVLTEIARRRSNQGVEQ